MKFKYSKDFFKHSTDGIYTTIYSKQSSYAIKFFSKYVTENENFILVKRLTREIKLFDIWEGIEVDINNIN